MLSLAKVMFSKDSFDFVDLYTNDIEGLEISFEKLTKIVEKRIQK